MLGPCNRYECGVLDDSLAASLRGLPLSWAFREQAQRMPPISRRLLLEDAAPSTVDPSMLLDELMLPVEARAAAQIGVDSADPILQRQAVLPPEACARLRDAVDAERQQKHDSVDGAPDHQLNLSRERLDDLIGATAAAALWRLPGDFSAAHVEGGLSVADARIFVRRYSPAERPWNPFHTDSAALTINVALSASGDGGELLACYNGGMRRLLRREGEATVHSSTLLHGVTALRSGLRYSLIIFVGSSEVALPAALQFDHSARRAEAADLAWLLRDGQSAARCAAVLTGGASIAEAAAWASGREQEAMGWDVQTIVQRYAAPHLRPSSIRARAAAARGPTAPSAGRAEDATCESADALEADDGRWCWSLRALLVYARQADAAAV